MAQRIEDFKGKFYGGTRKNRFKLSGAFPGGAWNEFLVSAAALPQASVLTNVSDAVIIADKEFIRIRVNSNSKPEQIYFYKSYDDYKTDAYDSVVDANAVPLSIKNYFGYECYIPRSISLNLGLPIRC